MPKLDSGVTVAMEDRLTVEFPPAKIRGIVCVAVTLMALHGWAANGL